MHGLVMAVAVRTIIDYAKGLFAGLCFGSLAAVVCFYAWGRYEAACSQARMDGYKEGRESERFISGLNLDSLKQLHEKELAAMEDGYRVGTRHAEEAGLVRGLTVAVTHGSDREVGAKRRIVAAKCRHEATQLRKHGSNLESAAEALRLARGVEFAQNTAEITDMIDAIDKFGMLLHEPNMLQHVIDVLERTAQMLDPVQRKGLDDDGPRSGKT